VRAVLRDYEGDPGAWTNGRQRAARIAFDPADSNHALFVETAAALCTQVWGVGAADAPAPAPAKPPAPEGLGPTALAAQLRDALADGIEVHPIELEKDDDRHMDETISAANLSALNYRLEPAGWLKAKRIAGRIIPAVATTTAMVCGFVCLELYKVHSLTPKTLEDYRGGEVNRALARFNFSQPAPSPKFKLGTTEREFDQAWNGVDFPSDLLVEDVIRQLESAGRVKVRALRSEGYLLWSDSESQMETLKTSVTSSPRAR
jgi:ubiquitin-activating enzyme E1